MKLLAGLTDASWGMTIKCVLSRGFLFVAEILEVLIGKTFNHRLRRTQMFRQKVPRRALKGGHRVKEN